MVAKIRVRVKLSSDQSQAPAWERKLELPAFCSFSDSLPHRRRSLPLVEMAEKLGSKGESRSFVVNRRGTGAPYPPQYHWPSYKDGTMRPRRYNRQPLKFKRENLICTTVFRRERHHCCRPFSFPGSCAEKILPPGRRSFANNRSCRHTWTNSAMNRPRLLCPHR